MKYVRQTTDACKSLKYESKKYPYIYGKQGCIYSSGCGVCSTSDALKNCLKWEKDTEYWRDYFVKNGARGENGTDLPTALNHIKADFGVNYEITSDIKKLKSHVKQGYKAICLNSSNGTKIFSTSGHYIACVGYHKDGRLIIHDPYWYDNKFSTGTRKAQVEVNDRELYISSSNLDKTCSKYYLLTPTRDKDFKYSKNDINYEPKKVNKPKITDGKTYTTTRERGIYKGYGSKTGRAKYKDVVNENNKKYLTNKNGYAYYKKDTPFTVKSHKTLDNKNIWIKTPSGCICAYDYKPDVTSIKSK